MYVALTASLQVVRLPLKPDATGAYRWRNFLQLSGGLAGPEMAWPLTRTVTLQSHTRDLLPSGSSAALGEPIARLRSIAGIRTTNVAYGGADFSTLFITESEHGVILTAQMEVPGRPMYSHS